MTAAGCEVLIHGFVQGQGVRPALARLAEVQHWTGRVRNTPRGVLVALCDVATAGEVLAALIRDAHPALSAATITTRPCDVAEVANFSIDESATDGTPSAPVPRDVAVCADCLRDFHDVRDQRHWYGLISCSRCGPRFSIVDAMPFDRARTTLAALAVCDDCRGQYASPEDRRSHAQTIGCPKCGPQVWATDQHGRIVAAQDEACRTAADSLLQGQIVAVRGVGGYQLLVDATSESAVQELRRGKRRPTKPLAVMCRTVADAESLGRFVVAAKGALLAPANPIVIVPRNLETALAAGVHPHLADIGLMLPTTAVHDRLLELVGRPLVCTSGNVEGAPLVADIDEAQGELAGIADLWLHHNRPIRHPVDDSVVRSMAGRAVTIRLARGLAPLPLAVPDAPPIVALGGFQKTAIAWSNGVQSALGPHVGDLDDVATRTRFRTALDLLTGLYGIDRCAWAVDGHPDDAARLAVPVGIEPIAIWHHHAHIAAGMLEHGWLDGPVIGIAADGQGYGLDGSLWGGDVLWATTTGFRRLAAVRPFALPGGELAARDAGRVAIALLSQLPDIAPHHISEVTRIDLPQVRAQLAILRASITPWTTSLGRLFDGVARIVLGPASCSTIGEPAARLEALCDPRAAGGYRWTINTDCEPWEVDWRPMIGELLRDRQREESPGVIAERFHRGVAEWMLAVHRRCPPRPLVVGGGVFQNRRLCELLAEQWPADGPPLGLPGVIPPNDGGLAAGQLVIAAARLRSGQFVSQA